MQLMAEVCYFKILEDKYTNICECGITDQSIGHYPMLASILIGFMHL